MWFTQPAKWAEWAGSLLESWLHVCQLVVDPDIDLNIVIQTQYVLLFVRCPGLQSKTTPIFPGCSHFTLIGSLLFFWFPGLQPNQMFVTPNILGEPLETKHWKTLKTRCKELSNVSSTLALTSGPWLCFLRLGVVAGWFCESMGTPCLDPGLTKLEFIETFWNSIFNSPVVSRRSTLWADL